MDKVRIIPPNIGYRQAINNINNITSGGETLNYTLYKILTKKLEGNIIEIDKQNLPDNSNIIDKKEIEKVKRSIKKLLKIIKIKTKKEPIIIIRDECITNDWLERHLKKIIGKDYNDFVKVLYVNWLKKPDKGLIRKLNKNSLIIIGGSWTNVFDINKNWIKGNFGKKLSEIILTNESNNYILGVCHGQSYILQLLNLINNDSVNLSVTNKGPAYFGPAICKIHYNNKLPNLIKKALKGISNNGNNLKFTGAYTRSNKNFFDILGINQEHHLKILASDQVTKEPIIWSNNINNVIGTYIHPEIDFLSHPEEIDKIMKNLVNSLKYEYNEKDIEKITKNFENIGNYVKEEIGQAFYSFVIYSFLQEINKTLKQSKIKNINEEKNYNKVNNKIINETLSRLEELFLSQSIGINFDVKLGEKETKEKFLKKVDSIGLLSLNSTYGWIVNRGIYETGLEFGFRDINLLIEEIIENIDNKGTNVHILRDLGCGNGNFMREFDQIKDKEKNIVLQGIAKEVTFELLQGLMESSIVKKNNIPYDIVSLINILISEKYNLDKDKKSLNIRIKSIIEEIRGNLFRNISFSEKENCFIYEYTLPFNRNIFRPVKLQHKISIESFNWFNKNNHIINKLLNDIKENIYKYFEGYIERIYLADFTDMNFKDRKIYKSSVSISTKGTSQILSPKIYEKIIIDFIEKYSIPGAVFLDNGVMASYTSQSRIKELYKIQKKYSKDIKIKVLYDKTTNYFTGAIIMKKPFINENIFDKYLLKNFDNGDRKLDIELVDIEEASKVTYVIWERFTRDYILTSFRSFDVFWFYKDHINKFLIEVVEMSNNNKDKEDIKIKFVKLINTIVGEFNLYLKSIDKKEIEYNPININSLENYYNISDGETIDKIIQKAYYMPEWFNINGKRKYQ